MNLKDYFNLVFMLERAPPNTEKVTESKLDSNLRIRDKTTGCPDLNPLDFSICPRIQANETNLVFS